MILSNIHTHSTHCDGKNTLEEMVIEAIRLGFVSLGFSGHSETFFDRSYCLKDTKAYCDEVYALKKKYHDQLQVYCGIEADYYSNIDCDGVFEYRIGGVHYVFYDGTYFSVDESSDKFFEAIQCIGSIEKFIKLYYNNVKNMVLTQKPQVIAHLDLIRKFNDGNRYFDEEEQWYKDCVLDVLQVIASSNCIIELNTGGIYRGYTTTPYPSRFILVEAKKLGIDVMINADAHNKDGLAYKFDECIQLLKEVGYTEVKVLNKNTFNNVSII